MHKEVGANVCHITERRLVSVKPNNIELFSGLFVESASMVGVPICVMLDSNEVRLRRTIGRNGIALKTAQDTGVIMVGVYVHQLTVVYSIYRQYSLVTGATR